jgi:hypothetical protein
VTIASTTVKPSNIIMSSAMLMQFAVILKERIRPCQIIVIV